MTAQPANAIEWEVIDAHDFAHQAAIDMHTSMLTRTINRAPTRLVHKDDANLVSSKLRDSNLHAPVLDIDFWSVLLPSSTEGHYHLYLDKPMTWRTYRRLLRALAKAGVIERGYYKAAKARRATFVRKPGVVKVRGAAPTNPPYPKPKRLVGRKVETKYVGW